MDVEIIGNRYHLLEKLGAGGMGTVFRAQDRLTGDVVAIKRVTAVLSQFEFANGDATKFRLGLAQEFRVLATMRHPNIISVIDYGFDEQQQPFYTMELLTDAKNIIAYGQNKPLHTQVDLLIQTLQAMTYLHRRGVIHRDLKPDNILVLGDQVKVLDFGLAIASTHKHDQNNVSGTIAYMAPEVLMGDAPSFASDLYAFGVIGFELFANKYPFATTNMNTLLESILYDQPNVISLELPDVLGGAIQRLLEKNPADRYRDAETVLKIFAEYADKPKAYETATIRESYLQSARFVGRQEEMKHLSDALDHTKQQCGSLWLVGGESGVGKSRLMEELRTFALVNGVLVLRGQAIVEGGASYVLWRNVVRYLCLKVVLTDLEASVLQALVPDMSTLIDRAVSEAPTLDPDGEQVRLFNTLEAVFRRHAEPTLIIMEDLQWANESLALLGRFAKMIASLPLMIVGTFRDDERPELTSLFSEAHTLRLKRLSDHEIGELSESILGNTIGRRESLITLLRQETEGNAFFIVEIVRSLAESAGQLSNIGQVTLPATVFAGGIRQVIKQRLARVPADAYALLELMAVAGRELDLKLLTFLAPTLMLDQWIMDCNSVLDVQDNIWRFAHDKFREAILAEIPKESFQSRHAQVATALQDAYGNDPAYYVRLAYHWREAGRGAEESHFGILAGKQALALGNYKEAIAFFDRALTHYQSTHADPFKQATLTKLIGDAYFGLGQLNEASSHFIDALIPTAHRPPTTRLAIARQLFTNGVRQARYRLSPVPTPDTTEGDYLREIANACLQLSMIYYFKNEKFRALVYSIKGVNFANRAGPQHRDELSRLQATFAMVSSAVPVHGLARQYQRLAKRNMPNTQDVSARSWVLMMVGLYATNTAEWDIALPNLIECLSLAERVGNIRRYQEALLSLAAVYFFKGEWAKSGELAQKIWDSGLEYDNLQCQAWGLDDIGRVEYHLGNHAKALELFSQSRQIYEQISDTSGLIWVYGALAQVYTRQGQLDLARPNAEKVKGWLLNTPPGNYGLLEGYQGMADFYLTHYEQHRTPQSGHDAETAVTLMHRFGRIFNTGKAYRYIYEAWLDGLKGDSASALRLGKRAIQESQRYDLPYEEGLAAYHSARFLPKNHPQRAPLLAQAQRIFAKMGAKWDEARVVREMGDIA